ncbi:MAG: transcriptional regulator, GntR family [Acidobacteria bacterium]|nr:transcriptional regulator, GntR family [Acidobacteriota bacterium]
MSQPLAVVLDRAAGEAAYEQIAAQIRQAVATGALPPGTLLPGVRVLASDLGVNFNTVARAYRVLEEQGFVTIRERSGVEVATPAARASQQARAAGALGRRGGHAGGPSLAAGAGRAGTRAVGADGADAAGRLLGARAAPGGGELPRTVGGPALTARRLPLRWRYE